MRRNFSLILTSSLILGSIKSNGIKWQLFSWSSTPLQSTSLIVSGLFKVKRLCRRRQQDMGLTANIKYVVYFVTVGHSDLVQVLGL